MEGRKVSVNKKKMLMLATTAAMIEQFNKNNILILEEMGYEVHVAGNWLEGNPISDERLEIFKTWITEHGGKYFHISSVRRPDAIKANSVAYKKVVELIKEYHYEFIHCHTPIGSVIGRIAAHVTHTKIIYTAHGFHFFKGAPLKNWILYYPVERFLSRWTDMLITINQEDYQRAKKSFHAKKTEYISGVGVDIEKFAMKSENIASIKDALEIEINDFVITSVGEVNSNKNHQAIIKAIAKTNNKKIKYIICGRGVLEKALIDLSKRLGIEKQVYIMGYCDNVKDYLYISDLFAFPSRREGLGLAAIEAMAVGIPLLTSNIHGINDYSLNGKSGFTCSSEDIDAFANAILRLMENKDMRIQMGKFNKENVKKYDMKCVVQQMREKYNVFVQ